MTPCKKCKATNQRVTGHKNPKNCPFYKRETPEHPIVDQRRKDKAFVMAEYIIEYFKNKEIDFDAASLMTLAEQFKNGEMSQELGELLAQRTGRAKPPSIASQKYIYRSLKQKAEALQSNEKSNKDPFEGL